MQKILLSLFTLATCVVPLFSQSITAVQADFSAGQERDLVKDKFGGYTPEKVLWVSSIYDTAKTLGPLGLRTHRFQLWVNDVKADKPGWTDSGKSQESIIRQTAALGITSFVTINTPPAVKDSDLKMQTFFTSVAESLASYAEGKPIYLELFGEPDISAWDWYTGYTTFEKFYREFRIGYEAVAAVRLRHPHLKIGGCGFGFAHTGGTDRFGWYAKFINRCIANNIKLDFISFHYYYLWKDSDWLITTDQARHRAEIDVVRKSADAYRNSAAAAGRRVELILSEFSWPNGDWNIAFAEARSFVSYRNTARTLESLMYMGLELFPDLDKIYWAQSVGQWIEGWGESYDYWTFFPFVSWHAFTNGKIYYTYNAAYYAFWLYGHMPEKRCRLVTSDSEVRGFAAAGSGRAAILLWNRTNQKKIVTLSLQGLDLGAVREMTTVQIDSAGYNKKAQRPAVRSTAAAPEYSVDLAPEGTLYLELRGLSAVAGDEPQQVREMTLRPNYPNPFNGSTTIVYSLERAADVNLAIYTASGQMVEKLDAGRRGAGEHRLQWQARDAASGLYLIRLQAGAWSETRKCLLLH